MKTRFASLLALGLLPAAPAHASLDEEKLRLLSCEGAGASQADRGKASDWLNKTAQVLPKDQGLRLDGPVTLGRACLTNLRIMGSFGVMVIQGEICNTRLDDFTDALASAGIRLGKDVETKMPGVVLGRKGKEGQYLLTRGLVDIQTGRAIPTTSPYAFTCTASGGGPQ